METKPGRRRRSRIVLKSTNGELRHRMLELSEGSEASDSAFNSSEAEVVKLHTERDSSARTTTSMTATNTQEEKRLDSMNSSTYAKSEPSPLYLPMQSTSKSLEPRDSSGVSETESDISEIQLPSEEELPHLVNSKAGRKPSSPKFSSPSSTDEHSTPPSSGISRSRNKWSQRVKLSRKKKPTSEIHPELYKAPSYPARRSPVYSSLGSGNSLDHESNQESSHFLISDATPAVPSANDRPVSLSDTNTPALTPLLNSTLRSATSSKFHGSSELESLFPNRHIQVYIVTWNMKETKDLPESLDDLLLPLYHSVAADMFVIGTQESTPSRKEWEVLIQKTLGPSYVLVQSFSLGVIYLCLFIRRDLIWFCSAIHSTTFTTRPVSKIKTKGAIGISFTLFGSSFMFITSHFTANKNKVAERNADMQKIANSLSLSKSEVPTQGNRRKKYHRPMKYDYVFWFGDLNYRVDLDRQTADRCIANNDLMSLLLKDQLTKEILQGNTFSGFSEQPISFPPSYKFDVNSDHYDTSEKQRVPSWTDRVLFKSRAGTGINGCSYSTCFSIKCSDHRPVCAVFQVKLEPSSGGEGIQDTVAGFNRDIYMRANKKRKEIAEQKSEEVDAGSSVTSDTAIKEIPSTLAKEKLSIPHTSEGKRRKKVTSQVCLIL